MTKTNVRTDKTIRSNTTVHNLMSFLSLHSTELPTLYDYPHPFDFDVLGIKSSDRQSPSRLEKVHTICIREVGKELGCMTRENDDLDNCYDNRLSHWKNIELVQLWVTGIPLSKSLLDPFEKL